MSLDVVVFAGELVLGVLAALPVVSAITRKRPTQFD